MLVDTHCHVQFQGFASDRDAVMERCMKQGMSLLLVGTQKDTSRDAVALAERYPGAYASIGVHPNHLFPTHIDEEESHFISREEDFDEAYYVSLAASPKVAAVGECGLDLFHLPSDRPLTVVLEKQKRVFLQHVSFALERNLPMVIHVRDAHDEMIALLRGLDRVPRGTIHCYTSGWAHAEQYLSMGFYLGFTGVITFPPLKKNPQAQADLLDVVRQMPADRILLETDAPYLAPVPYRGERAEPWMTEHVAKKIGELRNISYEEVVHASAQNAKRLFTHFV